MLISPSGDSSEQKYCDAHPPVHHTQHFLPSHKCLQPMCYLIARKLLITKVYKLE